MKRINLNYIQSQLKTVNSFHPDENEKLNKLLNGVNKHELEEIKDFHFKNEVALVKYLKKSPTNEFKYYAIKPVNILRYRIYQELEANKKIEIVSFINNFEQLLLEKEAAIEDLPQEIQDLYRNNGWGNTEDPYHSWKSDCRKIIYDYIISPNNYEKLKGELKNVFDYFQERLKFENCEENIKGPWGSQNNSYHNFCWVAWCPGNSMKKTVHLGLRVFPDYIEANMYAGDDFYFETNLSEQCLRKKEFYDLEEAFDWLYSLKNICLELNNDEKKLDDELKEINEDIENLKSDSYTPKRVGSRDSLGLHTGRHQVYEREALNIEECHLYLFIIEGVHFTSVKFTGSGVYKIGMSSDPNRRKSEILNGFGLSSLLNIRKIFIMKKKAKYESQLKDFIDGNPAFYYDREYFCTDLTEENVKLIIKNELKRIESLENS